MSIQLYNGCRTCTPQSKPIKAKAYHEPCDPRKRYLFPGETLSIQFCFVKTPEPTMCAQSCGCQKQSCGCQKKSCGGCGKRSCGCDRKIAIPNETTNRVFEGFVTATEDWQYEIRRYQNIVINPGTNELVTTNLHAHVYPGDLLTYELGDRKIATTVKRVYENSLLSESGETKTYRFIQVADKTPDNFKGGCFPVQLRQGKLASFRFTQTDCDCYTAVLDPKHTSSFNILAQSGFSTDPGYLLGYFQIFEILPILDAAGVLFVEKKMIINGTLRTK
jgi:hypothetical protein